MGLDRYVPFFESLGDAVVAADERGFILHVNPALERLLGWTAAAAIGQPLTALMPARMRAAHEAGFARFQETGRGRIVGRPVRVPALRRDGLEIDIELTLAALTVDGAPPVVVATMRDLRERVELERQLAVTRHMQQATGLAARITGEVDVEAILAATVETLVGPLDAALARVWLDEDGGGRLALRASAGPADELAGRRPPPLAIATDADLAAEVARARQARLDDGALGGPGVDPAWVERHRLRARAAFPLVVGDRPIGVLVAWFRHRLEPERFEVLGTVAAALAAACDGARLAAEREHLVARLERERGQLHAAEAAERRARERLSLALEAGQIGTWDWDLRGAATWDAGFRRVMGFPDDAPASAARFLAAVHPEDRPRIEHAIGRGGVQGASPDVEVECRIRRERDGAERWVVSRGKVSFDAAGVPIRFVGTLVDVTTRRRTEEDLGRSRNELASILRTIADGITVHDASGRVLYANEAAARLSGVASADAMVGRASADLLTRFDVRDADGAPLTHDQLPAEVALRTGAPTERLMRVMDLVSGEERWSQASASPFGDPAAGGVAVINVFRDVTAQTQAEHAWRFLAEASSVLASSLDVERTLQSVAELAVPGVADWCAVELTGDGTRRQVAIAHVDPSKLALAQELRARWPPALDESSGVGKVLATGRPELWADIPPAMIEASAHDDEHRALLRGLAIRSIMIVPMIAGEGPIGAITFVGAESGRRYGPNDLGFAEEIARRSALAIENARLYRQAQEAIRHRDDFLSVAAHELRTPVTTLSLHTEMLREMSRQGRPLTGARLDAKLGKVDAQMTRLQQLIDVLLDVSRVSQGRLELDCGEIDLSDLLREVVSRFTEELERAGCAVTLDVPPSLATRGDAVRLDGVFTNLLTNAMKFGSGEPVEIACTAHNGTAVVKITDHGIGIPDADHERVFGRFERAVSGSHYSGLGLGLWIARQVVEAHGGAIAVDSAPGRGATFTVELPR